MFHFTSPSFKINLKGTKGFAFLASFLLMMFLSASTIGTANAQNCSNCVAGPTSGNLTINSDTTLCFTTNANLNNMVINGANVKLCISPGVTVIIQNNINLNSQTSLALEIGGILQFNQAANLQRPLRMNILAGGEFRSGPSGNVDLTIAGTTDTNIIVNNGLFRVNVLGFGTGINQIFNNKRMQIGSNININGTTTFRNQDTLLIQNSYNNSSNGMFINCAYMRSNTGYNLGGGRVINTGNFEVINSSVDFGTGGLFENYGTVTHTGSSVNLSGLTSRIYNEGLFSTTSIQGDGRIEGPALNSGKLGYIEITGNQRLTMNSNFIGPNLDFTYMQGTANLGDGRPNTTKPGNGQNGTNQNNNRQYLFQNFNATFVNVETISFACRQGASNTCAASLVTTGMGCPNIFGVFPPPTYNLSGTVYNDANAGAIDGIAIQSAASTQLYVSAVNSNNAIAQTSTVAANGAYSFTALPTGNYTIVLHTTAAGSTTSSIPSTWAYTAEGILANGDGTPNGSFAINLTANETNTAFGIQQRPIAGAGVRPITNQNGTVQLNVSPNNFTNTNISTDSTLGTVTSIRLTSFPSGAASVVINGTAYTTDGSNNTTIWPNIGVTVPTNGSGAPTQTITVDPAQDGATTLTFSFVSIDNAGAESANTGTAVLNASDNLANDFEFQDRNQLSAVCWDFYDMATGRNLVCGALNSNIFGNQTMISGQVTNLQGNTGILTPYLTLNASVNVKFNWLKGGEPGTSRFISIKLVDESGVNHTLITENVTSATNCTAFLWDATYNLSTFNLPNGRYRVYINLTGDGGRQRIGLDNIQVNAVASCPRTIEGTVFNDVNGLTDNTVSDGSGTNAGGLFATLVTANNNRVVASKLVNADGSYNFGPSDNVRRTTAYKVVLTTTQPALNDSIPTATLPTNWVSTGEFRGAGNGNDGLIDGVLAFNSGLLEVTNTNLGIQQLPTAVGNTATTLPNPGATTHETVAASTFSGTDPDGGIVSAIRISTFPSNATTVKINNVDYTSSNWPVDGVEIPTNANGNPTQTITVDPVDGDVNVEFTFFVIDNAGFESSNSSTAVVPFTGVRIITLTATPVCIDDVPYMDYSISANFDTTGLLATITWTTAAAAPGIANPLNVPLVPTVVATNQPLNGLALWPGATVDNLGNPTGWPGWVFDNGNWIFQENGFSGYRTNPGFVITINPSDSIAGGTNYPPATGTCSSNPTFDVVGTVFNDVNGFTDGLINGTPTNLGGVLYVSLVDNNNQIIATSPVDNNGEFSFTDLKSAEFSAVLHMTPAGSTTPALPTDWVNPAQGFNSTFNTIGNGVCDFVLATTTEVLFAIQLRPTAGSGNGPITQSAGINPPDGTFLNVPKSLFVGADSDNGSIQGIKIVSFPTNTDRILYQDTTYYPNENVIPSTCSTSVCMVFPQDGLLLLFNHSGDGFESPFSFDPSTGALEVNFPYQVLDNAGFFSSNTAFSTLNFNNAPLNVGCTDFTAKLENGSVELTWVTASETQNRGFRIERSTNGIDFKEVAWIAGNGTTTNINTYNFIDYNPENGRNYYRLVAEEQSGKLTQVCKIITIEVAMNQQRIEIYPNPVSSLVFFKNFGQQISSVEVINLNGATVNTFNGNISEINVTQLPAGVYTLRISTVHGTTVHKLVVTR